MLPNVFRRVCDFNHWNYLYSTAVGKHISLGNILSIIIDLKPLFNANQKMIMNGHSIITLNTDHSARNMTLR